MTWKQFLAVLLGLAALAATRIVKWALNKWFPTKPKQKEQAGAGFRDEEPPRGKHAAPEGG